MGVVMREGPGPFAGHAEGIAVLDTVLRAVADLHDVEVRATTSQVALRTAGRGFAWIWRPAQYVRSSAPAVLSLALPTRVHSARFKEVVHPAPSHWMHHLELATTADVDAEVSHWLRLAYDSARTRRRRDPRVDP